MHNDLLLSGVVYDREAELSQFLAGLDDRKHPTHGLAVLDFQDLTHLGIPSAYTFQNVISHLGSEEGKRLQSSIVRGKGVPLEGEGGPETVLFSLTKFSGNKRKKPDSKDRGITCN